MPVPFRRSALLLALGLMGASATVQAHRSWLLPSATVFSAKEPWVTVDAASSNDVFYFEHNAVPLDDLVVLDPRGRRVAAENASKGRHRSSFDVKLSEKGTYRIALVRESLNASYRQDGETKRLRGTAESLARQIPAGAEQLSVTASLSRTEIFVTSGQPSLDALQPSGRGLELQPVTHPNDLVAGETATFRFLLDGRPVAGYTVSVVPGGIRYRSELKEQTLHTDAQGEVRIRWPEAGMYWLNVSEPRPARAEGEAAPAAPSAGGTLAAPLRRAGYTATLEVLPQ